MNPVLRDSKVISILYQNKNTKDRITLRQQNKSKMTFMSVENHCDKIARKINNYRRISDEILLRQKLIHSTSMDDYMLSAGSTKTSAYNRRLNSNLKNDRS
ncbi:MAG: hypothetical protein ACR2F1_07905 [Nitrososphaeraceae archaeon]